MYPYDEREKIRYVYCTDSLKPNRMDDSADLAGFGSFFKKNIEQIYLTACYPSLQDVYKLSLIYQKISLGKAAFLCQMLQKIVI
jgi:hypothetical protein